MSNRLRSDAKQAMAPVIQRWASLNDYAALEASGEVLDALLDYLEAHTDEWEAAAINRNRYTTADLLAVLRVEP